MEKAGREAEVWLPSLIHHKKANVCRRCTIYLFASATTLATLNKCEMNHDLSAQLPHWYSSMKLLRSLVVIALTLACTNAILAQGFAFAYSNYPDGFTGQGYSFGASGLATQGGVTFTAMYIDNIILDPRAANQSITQIYFTATNRNTTSASARAHLRFYADDNGGNAPGTYLTGYDFSPLFYGGNNTTTSYFFTPATPLIIPANARIWAGWLLDNGGGATATSALLQNFGVSIFSAYTAGSGTDAYFLSPAPGSGTYDSNNPPGSLLNASPSGSFGWRFQIAVPEPATWALIGLLALLGVYAIRRATLNRQAELGKLVELE